MRVLFSALLGCTLSLSFASYAIANTADYPNKPIRFVVPYPPGGLGDTFSRALGRGLAEQLGQPVIVENKPGASQVIGAEQVLRAPADGYTLFLSSMTSLATNLGSHSQLSYDPIKDFAPVSKLFSSALYLAVKSDLPIKSVADLVKEAKAQPGTLSYASLGLGGSLHLAGELFSQAAGINMLHVPYKGSVPALTDVMGGVVTMIFDGGSTVAPQVKAGKLRVLAVTGKQRSSIDGLENVPTMAEEGFPTVDVGVWWGLSVRGGTSDAIVERLSKAVNVVINEPQFRSSLSGTGMDIQGSTPKEYGEFIESEAVRWPAFMKQIGVVPQ
ncbi:tripartite tricarboxylate transporter substrate binding protein [Pusillimonas sp. TS35]|uniref:Bug family tripartite tricarboxylate transporter substrate binding protein n=1 Tax=Paracandidimonas lactea TaxID=2895524 RepID=UPI00136D397E|nr:tripartite tricarboxylate transporter substrate binding protein [Paracandidimonas lactea]MYN13290.1 tripartite tricarboxylate transporter substrate binding protein [Pusillimonas sp. TS35]